MTTKGPNQIFREQYPHLFGPNKFTRPTTRSEAQRPSPKMNGSRTGRAASPPPPSRAASASPPPKKGLPTPRAGAAGEMRYVPTPSKTKTKPSTVPRAGAAGERRTSGGPNKKRK